MKAIVWTKYGSADGLQLREVPSPTPRNHEVLIRVEAGTVTAGDSEIRRLKFPLVVWLPLRLYMGIRRPRNKILGQELAGEIEAIGKDVTLFKIGDQVFGTTGIGFGANAEFICVSEDSKGTGGVLAIKPASMTYDEAAAVPVAGLEALHFLRRATIQPGQKVLIFGAGGSIGTFAVQLAKYYGAHVTGVDSTAKLDMLRSIGADQVIDYTQQDFTKNGETYDVILDVVGKSAFSGSLRSLNQKGRYLLANPAPSQMIRGKWVSIFGGKQVIFGPAVQKSEDLRVLRELIEAGKLKTVIDRRYPLEQVAEAHRYVDTGQKKGNVVISVTVRDNLDSLAVTTPAQ